MTDREAILKKLPFWNALTPEEAASVRRNAALRTFAAGAVVNGCTGTCLGMIFVVSGELRAYLLSEEGREITLFRLYAGDPCVLTASCVISQITFETQMKAETATELLVLSPDDFGALSDGNIRVRCFLYELATMRFSEVVWAMQQILFMGFDRRLALFLMGEAERTGSMRIQMTHEQIAQNTGSAREVVSRVLKRFAEEGLVEVSRGSIGILDSGRLRALANSKTPLHGKSGGSADPTANSAASTLRNPPRTGRWSET